jgi:hypothetical protein
MALPNLLHLPEPHLQSSVSATSLGYDKRRLRGDSAAVTAHPVIVATGARLQRRNKGGVPPHNPDSAGSPQPPPSSTPDTQAGQNTPRPRQRSAKGLTAAERAAYQLEYQRQRRDAVRQRLDDPSTPPAERARLQRVHDRLRDAIAAYSQKLSRFFRLDVARAHLAGPTPAHRARLGAFRVLADMWNEYSNAAQRLRQLRRDAPKLEATAGKPAVDDEIAALEARMRELAPWTTRRKQFASYIARLAGAMNPTPSDAADIDAAVEYTVRRLPEMGYDLEAEAQRMLSDDAPPRKGKKKATARPMTKIAALAPWPQQNWDADIEALVQDAAQEESRAGTSWLTPHSGPEAVSYSSSSPLTASWPLLRPAFFAALIHSPALLTLVFFNERQRRFMSGF